MEKCYEYFACKQTDCIMHNNHTNQYCWEAEGTLSNTPGMDSITSRLNNSGVNKCTYCIYKQETLSKIEHQNNTHHRKT